MADHKSVQINKLLSQLPAIIEAAGYSELYGYDLATIEEIPNGTVIRDRLLDKFLVANTYHIGNAALQLQDTLKWRKAFNPLSAGFLEKHDEVLQKIGVITSVPLPLVKKIKPKPEFTPKFNDDEPEAEAAPEKKKEAAEEAEETAEASTSAAAPEETDAPASVTEAVEDEEDEGVSPGNIIVTWNLYGQVPNRSEVFGRLDAFLRYRVGLMEEGIAALDFTKPETSYMAQVHDYDNVSFFRLDGATKEASKAVIDIFTKYYPELLNTKFFVNVPRIMSWMFSFTRLFLAKATVSKFHVVAYGQDLALQTGHTWVPVQYGGNSESFDVIALKGIEPRDASLVTKYVKKAPEPEVVVAAAAATTTEAAEEEATATAPAAAEPGAVPEEPVATATTTTSETKVAAPEPAAVPKAVEKEAAEEEAAAITAAPAAVASKAEEEEEVATTAAKEVEPKTAAV